MIVIDRKAYAEEVGVEEDELEPLPWMTPSYGGRPLLAYRMGLPARDGSVTADFPIDRTMSYDGGLVRFGNHPPKHYPFEPNTLFAGDIFHIHYRITVTYSV